MKIERRIDVAAMPVEAFAKLSDTKLLASLMSGFMDWYPTDEPNRFRTVVRADPAPLGGEIELEFWPESNTVVWHSVRGVSQIGRLMVRKKDVGSEVTFRIFYHLDGGLASRLAERVASIPIERFMREALERLRKSIEAQPPRPRSSRTVAKIAG